jgi:multiple antibiotic resistance protein
MPLTIDAGVISVAITVGANHAHTFKHAMIQLLASVIGASIIALSILLTYRYAQRVGKRIGHTGMMVVVRLSAFIMLCIGVGITWNGVKALLAEIGMPRMKATPIGGARWRFTLRFRVIPASATSRWSAHLRTSAPT